MSNPRKSKSIKSVHENRLDRIFEALNMHLAKLKSIKKCQDSSIGGKLHISGNVQSNGLIKISGEFEGEIRAHHINIKKNGILSGRAICETLTVAGEILGKAYCRELIVVEGAKLTGDITYANIQFKRVA